MIRAVPVVSPLREANSHRPSASVHVTLETGALRNRYELILNYDYTDPDTGERKTGRIEGE